MLETILPGGGLKYFLVGADGKRVMKITQDQALTLKIQSSRDPK